MHYSWKTLPITQFSHQNFLSFFCDCPCLISPSGFLFCTWDIHACFQKVQFSIHKMGLILGKKGREEERKESTDPLLRYVDSIGGQSWCSLICSKANGSSPSSEKANDLAFPADMMKSSYIPESPLLPSLIEIPQKIQQPQCCCCYSSCKLPPNNTHSPNFLQPSSSPRNQTGYKDYIPLWTRQWKAIWAPPNTIWVVNLRNLIILRRSANPTNSWNLISFKICIRYASLDHFTGKKINFNTSSSSCDKLVQQNPELGKTQHNLRGEFEEDDPTNSWNLIGGKTCRTCIGSISGPFCSKTNNNNSSSSSSSNKFV